MDKKSRKTGRNCKGFGKLIADMRRAKGFTQEALAENLLTGRAISNLENRGELPDWLVFDMLVRRLGASTQLFMTMLSEGEYEYLCWKEDMLKKIEDGSIRREDWDSEMAHSREFHEALQGQFVEFWKGYMQADFQLMVRAIARTVRGYPKPLSEEQCVSSEEITYMLLSMEKLLETRPQQWEKVRAILVSIIRYMEVNISEEERVNGYAKAVCLYGDYIMDADAGTKLACYKKALELYRRQAVVTGICDILRGLLREGEMLEPKERMEYEQQLRAIEWVKREFQVDEVSFAQRELTQEFCLLHEVLGTYRQERGLKIQDIERHACSGKTYRALEKGKRAAKKGTYLSLADYMDIPLGIYNTEIISDNYRDLKLAREIKCLLHRQQDETALLKLEKLEKSLGDKIWIEQNMQFVFSIKNIILYEAGTITQIEYQERLEELIRLTIPEWNIDYEVHFYTPREMVLVYYDAMLYRKKEDYDTAIHLLNMLWKQLERSRVSIAHRGNEALLINTLWKDLLTDIKDYEGALDKVKIGMELSFATGRCAFLDEYIFEPGWIINDRHESLTEKERIKCLEYFRNAFYISRLFGRTESQKIIRSYCKRKGFDLF